MSEILRSLGAVGLPLMLMTTLASSSPELFLALMVYLPLSILLAGMSMSLV